ncbi:MAG: hypothetical protein AAGG02_14990, partial [Cyanobacteria bacterium P01_H01_bin.15]
MQKRPFIFSIDVEPDPRLVAEHTQEPWHGFEQTVRLLTEFRPRLEDATGSKVQFSWFLRMDPQIEKSYGRPDWINHRYGNFLEEFTAQGDTVGLHTHSWRWHKKGYYFNDFGSRKWTEHCLDMSFSTFRKVFARDCTEHRMGDRFLNQRVVNSLKRRGVLFELTPEPGYSSSTWVI